MIEQLIIVRHGETLQNVAGIVQGWSDSALTEKGARQVQRLAERIAQYEPTAIYSSTLGRAISTAEAISAATGIEVHTLDDLREMRYGTWEERSFWDVRKDDYETYKKWIADPDCPCPEGESHNDVLRRLERALANIDSARPVVVSHGTAIRIGATLLLNAPVLTSRHLAQDNAALNVFVKRGERWVMQLWNDTTHCVDE